MRAEDALTSLGDPEGLHLLDRVVEAGQNCVTKRLGENRVTQGSRFAGSPLEQRQRAHAPGDRCDRGAR